MKAKRINILFAALVLGTTGFCQPPKNETGVFLTTDQGETWKPASTGLPNDANISSWVVTRNNTIVITTLNYGVFKSFDGKSWDRTGHGLPKDILASSIADHSDILFIGSFGKGVFSSRDHGNSWKEASTGLNTTNIHCFHAQDNTLFAGTDKGIYASSNEGMSWTLVTGNMRVNNFREAGGILFASTNLGTLRSEDRGESWDRSWVENALSAPGADSVKVSPSEENTFRITPASPPVSLTPWKNVFRSLRENRPFRNIGLPADMSFNNILVTPFGILVARKNDGC
ncbi:hypothetical protein KK062_03560 [Fulvivirgaceae bacterium PWU5]|uniref:DUF6242 domain-containing protein n=1 Tax=Dawidia cretensis TaxID=2782350 RepID=A0AAP2GTE9_9BACT|nr:hypothetical protein [Dawidia cretensis]MBT1707280.1 hypothetical protein [Dawidia cretensis]